MTSEEFLFIAMVSGLLVLLACIFALLLIGGLAAVHAGEINRREEWED